MLTAFIPSEDLWHSFLLQAESTPRYSAAGRLTSKRNLKDFTGILTRDRSARSAVQFCNKDVSDRRQAMCL